MVLLEMAGRRSTRLQAKCMTFGFRGNFAWYSDVDGLMFRVLFLGADE